MIQQERDGVDPNEGIKTPLLEIDRRSVTRARDH
jgi:hypothetical protein